MVSIGRLAAILDVVVRPCKVLIESSISGPVIGQSSLIASSDWLIRDISINRNLETTRNSLAILWSFSFLVKFWFSMYSPCLVRKENIYSNLLSIARDVTGIYEIFKNLTRKHSYIPTIN